MTLSQIFLTLFQIFLTISQIFLALSQLLLTLSQIFLTFYQIFITPFKIFQFLSRRVFRRRLGVGSFRVWVSVHPIPDLIREPVPFRVAGVRGSVPSCSRPECRKSPRVSYFPRLFVPRAVSVQADDDKGVRELISVHAEDAKGARKSVPVRSEEAEDVRGSIYFRADGNESVLGSIFSRRGAEGVRG